MKDTGLDYMVYQTLKQVVQRSNIDPQVVEDVCLGNVHLSPTFPVSTVSEHDPGQ